MKVFIIDDDELFLRSLTKKIKNNAISEIHEFSALSNALNHLKFEPQVIILDHYLQGNEGTDLIPFIREQLPRTQIIYISGQEDVEILAKAKRLGADHYFKKDLKLAENIVRVIQQKEEKLKIKPKNILQKIKSLIKKKRNTKLFVVDDDELYSVFLRYKLSQVGNFDIDIYLDEQNVLGEIEQYPDLVILDYNLVKVKGDVILKEFKKKSPATKVIILSSQENIDIAINLFDLGIDDYVVKNKDWQENLLFVIDKYSN